jgi:hypothetical protein
MPRIRVELPVSIPAFRDAPIGVRFVPLSDVRRLVTIHPNDRVWTSFDARCPEGAIVRVRPPATASDADVERVEAGLKRAGAVRVRVEPRVAGEKVVAPVNTPKRVARSTMREMVLAMVQEARTHNREALRDELERAMTKAGI